MASLPTKTFTLKRIMKIEDKIFIDSFDNIILRIIKTFSLKSIKICILFFSILTILFSCKKDTNENVGVNTIALLQLNTWYAEKIQKISFNLNTNQFIKDTTYFTDSCRRNERIKMLNDSIAVGFLLCGAPYDTNGKWYLHSDSITVAIFYPIYGTSIYIYKGIKPSKLMEIDNVHFVTKETKIDGDYIYTPSPSNEKEEYYTTYKKY